MSSSFSGITIVVLGDPDIPRTAPGFTTERHIPWGNTNYVDQGGQGLPHVKLTLLFTSTANFLTFEALVNTKATLVYVDGTYTAILVSTARKNHGAAANQQSEVECDFLLVSSP